MINADLLKSYENQKALEKAMMEIKGKMNDVMSKNFELEKKLQLTHV